VELSYWLRLSGIIALFLGSIYVLLPTVLQEDLETRLANQAGSVETSQGGGPDLDVNFSVAGSTPMDVAPALESRLKAAGIKVMKVAAEAGEIVVDMAPGTARADVIRLAARKGQVQLLDPRPVLAGIEIPDAIDTSTLSPEALALGRNLPEAQRPAFKALVASVTRNPVPADAAPLDVMITGVTTTEEGSTLTLDGALPEGLPMALVAIDGTVTAFAVPGEAGVAWVELTRSLGGAVLSDPDALSLLASPPLAGTLTVVAEAVEAAPEATDVAVAAPNQGLAPDWFIAMLPDTQMNLGLDLQGGIDLTLQVDLGEAVLGQVTRDAAGVKDTAAREGLEAESIRRAHGQPQILITSDASLSDIDTVVQKATQNDYVRIASEGTTHTYEMAGTRQKQVETESVEQVLETLRKRVDETGVKEPSIVKKGGGRINVQLPGMVDVKAAVDAIGTTAVLQFRMVDEEFDDAVLAQLLIAAEKEMPADQFASDELLNVFLWESDRLDRDRVLGFQYEKDANGNDVRVGAALPMMADVKITGNDISSAGVRSDPATNQTFTTMDFKPRGTRTFCEITSKAVGKRFAILLDDQVTSAPSIKEKICGGAARIEVDDVQEAQKLALVLRTGSLDAPVVVASVRQVGATLGADSIRAGTTAAGIGGTIVLLFMLAWYRTSGLIADAALIVNILLVLACLAVFGATLTLPGIAGIALTAGMAVDANIIIYERIREELRLGVHPRKAVDVGFDKAIVAVLDANITTAIAGVVLFSYGSGPIKGFAVTLLIGIITTLVSALFVTRTLMDLVTRSSSARLRI